MMRINTTSSDLHCVCELTPGRAPGPAWTCAETRINCTSFVLLLKQRLRKFSGRRNPSHSKHFANPHMLRTDSNFRLLLLIKMRIS